MSEIYIYLEELGVQGEQLSPEDFKTFVSYYLKNEAEKIVFKNNKIVMIKD